MAKMTSLVWGNVPREILTFHLEEASSWAGAGCSLYAYARSYGVRGCKHPGYDITMPEGTPLHAIRAGTVKRIRNQDISGRMEIVIGDALGHEHLYTHLSRRSVAAGQRVTQGQLIGHSGTMNSPHLHFEHRVPQAGTVSGWGFRDPEPLLTSAGVPVAPTAPASTSGVNLAAIRTDFRKIGDTSLAVYEAEFRRLNSPLLPQASAIYSAARGMSALALAQMFMENKYSTVGFIIKVADNNPLAMRPWEADPRRTTAKPVLAWDTRAQVGTMVLPPHYAGAIQDSTGKYFARFTTVADAMAEYTYRLGANSPYKGGVYNPAKTLQQMLDIYAPSGDIHPVTGIANENSGYYSSVVTMLQRYASMGGTTTTVPVPGPTGTVSTGQHKFILSMGHRNTGGGNPKEAAWTPGATRALRDAIVARGGQAWILQEVDGLDRDADWFPGDHTAGARRCVELESRFGPFRAYLSQHYNGSGGRGAFAIFPDGPAGSGDTRADNASDVQLVRRIAAAIKATNTVPLLGWMKDGPGSMSERETHVGSQGHRLGEFSGTAPMRGRTDRVIIEAGGGDTADATYLNNPQWVRYVYAEAVVNALEAQYGKFTGAAVAPAKFKAGQAVHLTAAHGLFTVPGGTVSTVTVRAGTNATIISGPRYVNTVPWWNVRVQNVGAGHVAESALQVGAVATAPKGPAGDPAGGAVPVVVNEGTVPGADMGPEGWLYLPLDGSPVAHETSLGRDFSLTVQEPVRWVKGPHIGSFAALVEEATTNHAINPIAAVDTAGWTAGGATLSRVADAGGTWFGAVATGTGTFTVHGGGTNGSGNRPAVVAGDVWTLSATIRSAISRDVSLRIDACDAAGTLLSRTNGVAATTDTAGQRRSVTATAPANTAYMVPYAQMTGTGAAGDWFEVTRFQLEKKPYATSFTPQLQAASRNLLLNPDAESDLTGIFGIGATATREPAGLGFIPGSMVRVALPGTATGEGIRYDTATGLGWTGTARTVIGSIDLAAEGAVPSTLYTRIRYTDGTSTDSPAVADVLDGIAGHAQRFVSAPQATDPARTVDTIQLLARRTTAAGAPWTLYADRAQIEEVVETARDQATLDYPLEGDALVQGAAASAYTTALVPSAGAPMPGHGWNGTAHASTSTRTAGVLKADVGNLNFRGPRGSAVVRFRTAGVPAGTRRVWGIGQWATASRNCLTLGYDPATGAVTIYGSNGATTMSATYTIPAPVPEWVTVYAGWEDGAPLRLRVEGGPLVEAGTTLWQSQAFWGGPLYVGANQSGQHPLGDAVDQFIHFDRRLTLEQYETVRTTPFWSSHMLMTGAPLAADDHHAEPSGAVETAPYTPPKEPPRILLGAEPFMREGRQYAVTMSIYRGTIRGEVIEPLALEFDGTVSITHNDDAPIKRTMSLPVHDILDLRRDRALTPYADTMIPFMTVTDEDGTTRAEQLGVYILAPFGGVDTPTDTATSLRGNDLTWLLARAPVLGGWTAPGTTEIGLLVAERLRELGFAPSQISIGNTGVMTPPGGVPFYPGTNWLQAINTLLKMAGWYHLWMTRKGVLTSRPYVGSLMQASPVVHYDTRRGHWLEPVVEHDPDYSRFCNIAVAQKTPTTRNDPYIGWTAVNTNPASPTSVPRIGPLLLDPIIEGDFKTEAEARAAAEAALERGQSFYHRITITSGVELTAEANEVVAVDVARADTSLVTGRWWRQSWVTTYNGAFATTTHHLNHVEVF